MLTYHELKKYRMCIRCRWRICVVACFVIALSSSTPVYALRVVATSPACNALNAPENTPISVTFDSPIDPATATQSTIRVYGLQSGYRLQSRIAVDPKATEVSIYPDKNFRPGELVSVSVSAGVMDANGRALSSPFVWTFTIRVREGSGSFTKIAEVPTSSLSSMVGAFDMDADGDLDLVNANPRSSNIVLFQNDGRANFTRSSILEGNRGMWWSTPIDFDIDGDIDIFVTCWRNYEGYLFVNDGTGTFHAGDTLQLDLEPFGAAAADFNGDGAMDMAIANRGSESVAVLLNIHGHFVSQPSIHAGVQPQSLAASDFDNDGAIDIAALNNSSGDITILHNGGSAGFQIRGKYDVGACPGEICAADIDNDGDQDLIASDYCSSSIICLSNDGKGVFRYSSSVRCNGKPPGCRLGDLDGDGDLDLVIPMEMGKEFLIMQNDGRGTFSRLDSIDLGALQRISAIGDWNNDGALDIAVPNATRRTIDILLNSLKAKNISK